MNSLSTFLLILIVLLLGAAGYFYLDEVSPLESKLREISQDNEELRFQIKNLESQNEALSMQLEKTVEELSAEKNQEITKLKTTYDELILELRDQVETGEVTITQLADRLRVKILDRIIFPSGQSELTGQGVEVLKRVGNVLLGVKNKQIKMAGHTDNIPIHENLKGKFDSNWELSVARATNVVRFLHEEIGIDARHMEASGFAQYRPVASNNTQKGRARNRRIEILLLPLEEDLLRVTQKK
ncbi:MAG: OmpA family protein [bacterium]